MHIYEIVARWLQTPQGQQRAREAANKGARVARRKAPAALRVVNNVIKGFFKGPKGPFRL